MSLPSPLVVAVLHHQGSGLVRFFDPDCVTKALQCLDMPFEGRPILVREVGVCLSAVGALCKPAVVTAQPNHMPSHPQPLVTLHAPLQDTEQMRGNDFTRFQVQLNFSSRFSMWWMIKDVVRDTGDCLLLCHRLLLVACLRLLACCLLVAYFCCCESGTITSPASLPLTLLRARNAWLCS